MTTEHTDEHPERAPIGSEDRLTQHEGQPTAVDPPISEPSPETTLSDGMDRLVVADTRTVEEPKSTEDTDESSADCSPFLVPFVESELAEGTGKDETTTSSASLPVLQRDLKLTGADDRIAASYSASGRQIYKKARKKYIYCDACG